jgi:hypothetical protein
MNRRRVSTARWGSSSKRMKRFSTTSARLCRLIRGATWGWGWGGGRGRRACRETSEGTGSSRVSWSGLKAERAFIVGAVNADVAKASAGEARFVVESIDSIHWEIKFPVEPSFCWVCKGYLLSSEGEGGCRRGRCERGGGGRRVVSRINVFQMFLIVAGHRDQIVDRLDGIYSCLDFLRP